MNILKNIINKHIDIHIIVNEKCFNCYSTETFEKLVISWQ